MPQASSPNDPQDGLIASRLVRYDELRPCTTAFIDTRTPGSAMKENFTIIGPGVAENPDQHIHISIPHGFNIGGARQPPNCANSQHSHKTAEVFIVHSGRWAFCLGPNMEDGEVLLGPGDTISIPTHVFRGFKNIGDEVGFLFAILGGDDPGHVTWAPYVFNNAKSYGLILLEDGNLVDTSSGETIPPGKKPMPPTTEEDLARFNRPTAEDLAGCVVPREQMQSAPVRDLPGIEEYPIIGTAIENQGLSAGPIAWPHGFQLRHMTLDAKAASTKHARREEEVILMHKGRLSVEMGHARFDIGPGDVLTVPIDAPRKYSNQGAERVEAYVVRGGDSPRAAVAID